MVVDNDSAAKGIKDNVPIRILGIETSCDETAAAVVLNGYKILSNVVASQIDIHAQFGGVFPEVASRQHVKAIFPVVQQALEDAHLDLADIDAIAVTRGPGLPGSLVVGVNAAKGMALGSGLPLIGVNHLEGHFYASWLARDDEDEETCHGSSETSGESCFPILALIVSGGHTELVLVREHLVYERLGGTLDDAAGEAFDKVARLLGLPYPGGPAIQKAAENGDVTAFEFPRAWLKNSWDFSFSGLKTAVLREVNALKRVNDDLPVANLAASFLEAVVEVLTGKTIKAADEYEVQRIVLAGGVSANKRLREALQERASRPVSIPPINLCTDNAAMVAGAGYFRYLAGQRDSFDMDVLPTWPLSEVSRP